MKPSRFALIAALVIATATSAVAQTFVDGEEEVSASAFTLDVERKAAAYSGEYHFGFSEGESTLTLSVKGAAVTGTLSYGVWDEKSGNWKSRTMKFKGRIVSGLLIADKWYAAFVRFGDRRGLVFYDAPSDYVKGNFGYRMG